MKKKTVMRRLWLFKGWQWEQAESWLQDLAMQGWQLDYVGVKSANFKKCVPEQMKYRCIARSFFSITEEETLTEEYQKAGWRYVDSYWNMYIFCAPADAETNENHENPAGIRKALRKKILFKFLRCLLLSVPIGLSIWWVLHDSWNLLNSLLYDDLLLIFGFLFVLAFILYQIFTFIDITRVYNRAKRASEIKHRRHYTATLRLAMALFIVFTLTPIVLIPVRYIVNNVVPAFQERKEYDDVSSIQAPESIVLVSASDFTDPDYLIKPAKYNWYACRINHGCLFPDRMTLYNIRSSPQVSIQYECYRALTPFLAMFLGEQLAYSPFSEALNPMDFDRLWLYDFMGQIHCLLAVDGCYVYYIEYDGPSTAAEIAVILREKIDLARNSNH
jgi:hypothetical protein